MACFQKNEFNLSYQYLALECGVVEQNGPNTPTPGGELEGEKKKCYLNFASPTVNCGAKETVENE
jgi:hypothetical protein